MKYEGYKADRKALLEAVKFWKNSPLFRESGLQAEGEQISLAPWLTDPANDTGIVTRWERTTDEIDGAQFHDAANEATVDDIDEVLTYLSEAEQADTLSAAVIQLLKENSGDVLYIGRVGSSEAFAIQFDGSKFFLAEMELETEMIDEGLIAIDLVARTAPDPRAPVIPGFPSIEQRLYEALHAAALIGQTLEENDDPECMKIVETIDRFSTDLANVLVELMADQGSLSTAEIDLVAETFLGVYAGLVERAKAFVD